MLAQKFKIVFIFKFLRPPPGLGRGFNKFKIIFLIYKTCLTTTISLIKKQSYVENTMNKVVKKKQDNIILIIKKLLKKKQEQGIKI